MTDQTREEYAVFWGGLEPLAVCSSLFSAKLAAGERRFRATFEPESCFYQPLPEGEPQFKRRIVTTSYSNWEEAHV